MPTFPQENSTWPQIPLMIYVKIFALFDLMQLILNSVYIPNDMRLNLLLEQVSRDQISSGFWAPTIKYNPDLSLE